MCLIPLFYCDNCGHAFNHPARFNRSGVRVEHKRNEQGSDEARCPKCLKTDFEILIPSNYEHDKSTPDESDGQQIQRTAS